MGVEDLRRERMGRKAELIPYRTDLSARQIEPVLIRSYADKRPSQSHRRMCSNLDYLGRIMKRSDVSVATFKSF